MDKTGIFRKKKREIENEILNIESIIIPAYRKKIKETKRKLSESNTKFDDLEIDTEKQRKFWHQEVDVIFNKLNFLVKYQRENHLDALNSFKFKLTNLIQEMEKTIEEIKEILKTNTLSEVTDHVSKLQEYRDMPTDITGTYEFPSLKINKIVERELRIELLEYKATLTQTSVHALINETSYTYTEDLLKEARVIATIPSGLKSLWQVACVGTDEAWVSGMDIFINRVSKIHPNTQDGVIAVCRLFPASISTTKEGELIYSDWLSRTIYVVRNERTEELITAPKGWLPDRLCCTRSGDILVSLCRDDYTRQKVICYQGQKVKLEIEKDEHGDPIFEEGSNSLYVAGNNNGDICVSDGNAKIVIVLDKTGSRVQFIYDGCPVTSFTSSFNPGQIVTDSLSHIIVAETAPGCLHIIDQNGYFQRFFYKSFLSIISGLSIDSKERLWVGMSDTKEVKVIQYIK